MKTSNIVYVLKHNNVGNVGFPIKSKVNNIRDVSVGSWVSELFKELFLEKHAVGLICIRKVKLT